ncbi:MAG: hypothetical protein KGM44_00245, partial [bacterium]|nr:hypothetical protein [bacterium]
PSPPPAGNGTAYAVGATRTWCVSVATIGTSNITYQPVATTLLAQSTHLNLWVDNADTGQLTTANWQQLATDFDSIYPLDTQYFGGTTFPQLGTTQAPFTFTECTTLSGPTVTNYEAQPNFSKDNNGYGPQIDIVVTDKLGTGEGGYFDAINLVANASARCASAFSNEAEVFFALPPGQESQGFYLNGDVLRTEAHEFQHMLHAINKTYAGFASTGTEVFDPSWIDEGFSMLAEDLASTSGDPIRYAYQYDLNPGNYSLTQFEGYDCAPTATSTSCPKAIHNYAAGNYGAAYLFWRWAVDQYGVGVLKQVIASQSTSPGGSGISEVQAALGGAPFSQLFQSFSLAFGGSLKYGLMAPSMYGSPHADSANPAVSFKDSYGSYTIPSPCLGTGPAGNPPDPNVICNGNATATFNFPGPQPPSAANTGFSGLFAVNGPLQTLNLYDDTANYIPVSGGQSGQNSMSATDASGSGAILGGVAFETASNTGQAPLCSAPSGNKIGCSTTGAVIANGPPQPETFIVDMTVAPANGGGNAPALTQHAVNIQDVTGNVPPEPRTPLAAPARAPLGAAAALPTLRGDGFLRPDRPAAVGYQRLQWLFERGVIRGGGTHTQSVR